MSHSMTLPKWVLAIMLALMPDMVSALEIRYDPIKPPEPPQRRLMADPAQAPGAPSSLQIEVAKIQDGPADALRLAARSLEHSEAAYGAADFRTIIPRTHLAYARLWAGQAVPAQSEFRKAIDLLERAAVPRDRRLFEAWYGLGAAQFEAGLLDPAAESFTTAWQFHRIQQGLFSADQLDVLNALALTETRRGKLKDAERWQARRLEVVERTLPLDSPKRALTLISVGRWFRDLGRLPEAVALHQRAIAIKEKAHGADSPELVGALLDLALSLGRVERRGFRGNSVQGSQQDRALARAFRIATRGGDTPLERRVHLLHLIGDVSWVVGRRGGATEAYDHAAGLLRGRAGSRASFPAPHFLSFKPPSTRELEAAGDDLVVAEFAVDRLGRARHIEIVETSQAANVDELGGHLVRALQRAQLRPRMEGGRPVTTSEVRYRLVAPRRNAH